MRQVFSALIFCFSLQVGAQAPSLVFQLAQTNAFHTAPERAGGTHIVFFAHPEAELYSDQQVSVPESVVKLRERDFKEFVLEEFLSAQEMQETDKAIVVMVVPDKALAQLAREFLGQYPEMDRVEVVTSLPLTESRRGPSELSTATHYSETTLENPTYSYQIMESVPEAMRTQLEICLLSGVLKTGSRTRINIRATGSQLLRMKVIPGILGHYSALVPEGLKVSITRPSKPSAIHPNPDHAKGKQTIALSDFLELKTYWMNESGPTNGETIAKMMEQRPAIKRGVRSGLQTDSMEQELKAGILELEQREARAKTADWRSQAKLAALVELQQELRDLKTEYQAWEKIRYFNPAKDVWSMLGRLEDSMITLLKDPPKYTPGPTGMEHIQARIKFIQQEGRVRAFERVAKTR